MLDIILDTLIDTVKLIPFLFLTYLVMEYLEHRTRKQTGQLVKKAGRLGPLFGSIAGAFPQCGFSAAASNLFAGRVITLGTLIAIYLSTSDEMLPILISENIGIDVILKILGIKMLIGVIAGFIIDFCFRNQQYQRHDYIHEICEQEHCHCERGIVRSALSHTIQITFFIAVITFGLNMVLHFVGEDVLAGFLLNKPVIGQMAASLVGLIPNCAASVVITQLYLEGAMSLGAMMSGLLTGAGIGILVLCRVNHNKKENAMVIGLLYVIGVLGGIVVEYLQISL